MLPVYREYRHNGNTVRTIVRKYSGDVLEFAKEIERVLGGEVPVWVKSGVIKVKGDHLIALKTWLLKLGF